MERRKGIPLVALVIFIALLVAIILTCVIILGANKNDKQNKETQTQAIGEQTPPPEEPEDVTLESEDLINADQDVRDALNDRILAQQLENLKMERAYENGEKKGKREGKREGKKEISIKIAKEMIKKGFDIKEIIELTWLDEDEVIKLKENKED